MTTENTLDRKSLVADDSYGPVRKTETVAAGAALAKGTILGRITASRKLAAYISGATDGSQNPVAVLLEDAAAAAADVEAVAGYAGVYVEANTTGLDQAAEDTLEGRGIYFV